jgi:hypothetical protein
MSAARTIVARTVRTSVTATRSNALATRSFAVSTTQYKTATETVKEAVDSVDRTLAQGAIKGFEGLEKANEVVKETAGKVGINMESKGTDVEFDAKETANKAQAKGEQVKENAKEGVRDTAQKVKDAAR